MTIFICSVKDNSNSNNFNQLAPFNINSAPPETTMLLLLLHSPAPFTKFEHQPDKIMNVFSSHNIVVM